MRSKEFVVFWKIHRIPVSSSPRAFRLSSGLLGTLHSHSSPFLPAPAGPAFKFFGVWSGKLEWLGLASMLLLFCWLLSIYCVVVDDDEGDGHHSLLLLSRRSGSGLPLGFHHELSFLRRTGTGDISTILNFLPTYNLNKIKQNKRHASWSLA